MKNIILQKTRYLKAMMLTMLVGLFAFGANAQTFTISTPPPAPWYAGQEATVTYEASGFDAGTTFIVWDDADGQFDIDESETIFGSSTAQGASTDIDFNWGESGAVNLKLAAFSGNTVTGEVVTFERSETTVLGSNSTGEYVQFNRASTRSLTINDVDLSTTDPVELSFYLEAGNTDVDNPIEVLYSTDGFASAGTALTEDNLATAEFENINQYLEFTLPTAAKTANTSFRIRQKGTVDYGTTKNWAVYVGPSAGYTISFEIGETYSFIQTGFQNGDNVQQNQIIIDDLLDEADASETVFYPGDEVTIDAQLPNVDLTDLSFVATMVNNNTGAEYLLDVQTTPVKDNGTKDINVNGTIPTNIEYYTAVNGWDFRLQAYEGSEPLLGVNETVDFSGGIPADYTSTSTQVNFARGISFNQSGERSLLTPEFDITSTDGVLSLTFQRHSDLISPEGTDLIVEYTTDGETFTELTSIGINELIYDISNSTNTTIEIDSWPSGVVSSSTQFRVRQEANNGAGLDGWYFREFDIQNESNIVSNATINEAFAAFTMPRPEVTADLIEVGGDGLAFAMEDLTYTYTIDEGAFPTGTSAQLLLDRNNTPGDDIIIGTTANIASGTISFTVPPLEAGDYDVYVKTFNDQNYGFQTLSIYDTELTVTNITYENPVLVAGEEFGTPGSGITVNYSLLGDPGASAEIMLSIYDDEINEFVMISASNTINGTIAGTLPINFEYDNPPRLQLSLGNGGVFADSPFNEEVYGETFGSTTIPSGFTFEGNSIISGAANNLTSAGTRSVTADAQSFQYGARIRVQGFVNNYNGNPQDLFLQASTDGTSWIDIDSKTITGSSYLTFDVNLPNTVWSETTQVRLIYNEDGAAGFEENRFYVDFFQARVPEFLNTSVIADFNVIVPSLSVDQDFDAELPTQWYYGEEFTVNYNAVGFAAGTEFAVVIEQGNEYFVAGTSSAQGSGSVTATMPTVLPLDLDNPNDDYNFFIYPFVPESAGDTYMQGVTIVANAQEDFLTISGANDPSNFTNLVMDQTGKREILTRAFDLSGSDTATLSFRHNWNYAPFDINDNKNIVPRLEVSIDGGATFQTINVENLSPGEMSMYDEGLLYEDDDYEVGIPSEFLTEATHFRWSQPLNLGQNQNIWQVENIEIELGGGNAIKSNVYDESNTDFYDISINAPDLGDYTWSQADLQDAVFNGETFDYSFDYRDGLDATTAELFPAETTFDFYLYDAGAGQYVMDPETENPYVIASTTTLGTAQAEIPFYVVNGNYQVRLAASIDNEGEPHYIIGDESNGNQVGNLNVFLRVAELVYQGDPNAIIYAGQDVTFGIDIENNETNTETTDGLFANVILTLGNGDRLVVATQEGLEDVSFALPTDVWGAASGDFSLMLTENAALAEVGTILENQQFNNLQNDSDNFLTLDNSSFSNVSGRRLITTRDFLPAEIEEATLLSYDVSFNQVPADLTANQYVIFEFSTDAGATYTSLDTIPETGATNNLVGDARMFAFTTAMKENGVRFRWRQEEAKGNFSIADFDFVFGETLPFDYVDESIDIAQQALLVTNIAPLEICPGDDITLNYEIRGRFGADNVVTIQYRNSVGGVATINSSEANLVEGTGELTFSLPGNTLTAGANNGTFKIRLIANDETTDNTVTVNGSFSEESVELVAPIDPDADFSVGSQQLCDIQDVMVDITNPQDYFTYQVINAVSGEAIGDALAYDPELGDTEINLGALEEDVRLGLQITSASSSGATCNTITSTVERDFFVQPNYALFSGSATAATLVQPETVVDLCGTSLTLRASYYNSNGAQQNAINAQVEWFRDNLQTPVGSNASLSTFNKSGDYFARITDGNCIYTTESITVNVTVRPDQPAITVVSGDLVSCDETNQVVLEGPEGFAVYNWTRTVNGASATPFAANQRTITVSSNGEYRLQVSNATEANNCNLSNSSEPVIVNTVTNDDVSINIAGFGNAQAGQVYDICDNNGTTISVNGAVTGSSNVKWFQDGAEYAANTNNDGTVNINVSGAYYAEVTTGECTFTTPEVTFNVLEAPEDAPAITATGDLTFCDGQGSVVLEGPEGFAYYEWERRAPGNIGFNALNTTGATSSNNTIEVTQAGTYRLLVGNVSADGAVSCLSPVSNTITVNSRALPEMPRATLFDNSCGDGPVTFVLDDFFDGVTTQNVQSNVSYQLINAATDEASGLPVTGNASDATYITSDVITEETTFYIEATYADGSGCTVSYPETRAFTVTPNNVTLEVEGAQLIANYNGNATVRWYRDGVLLTGETSDRITISDAAEYSVEVEYASGCVVTASSADIAGKVLGNQDAMAMKVVSYPNPTISDATLNVNSQYMGKHEVIVTSMTGQIMMQSSFEKSSFEAEHVMNVANLEEGIYNVQIRHDGLTQNVRIIKK
ncbi:T9SS type A sorting domain-containing protein [Marivirga salinae]|uniref:T9SS type A sorting domain-containing protein n=1 Tax=Marivirga salinarum TaxID=3059078 RepID=A0AA51RBR8_9BACT|nr:T9SS type A sorting domain-containing protein [Marivirga sp. BDSF4-3]WMN12586.1 T9SS type A sorting domain-containing protein [Marivirga sp. BDSF4-3]